MWVFSKLIFKKLITTRAIRAKRDAKLKELRDLERMMEDIRLISWYQFQEQPCGTPEVCVQTDPKRSCIFIF